MKQKDFFHLYSIVAILLILLHVKLDHIGFLYGSIITLVFPIALPKSAKFLDKNWRKFGNKLGQIQSGILLGCLYLLIFPLIRIFKKKSKNTFNNSDFWENAEHINTDFTKQW